MKWLWNKHPENIEFVPDEYWNIINEDSINIMMIKALPLVIMLYLGMRLILYLLGFNYELEVIYLVPASIIMLFFHELLHAICFPESLLSEKVFFGAYPLRLMFYTSYTGEIGKKRLLLCLLAPLITITLIGIILMYVLPFKAFVSNIIFLNAAGSAFDILSFNKVKTNVPEGAFIKSKGLSSYWK